MRYEAKCHCGNIEAVFDTAQSIEKLGLRACACSFCRKHGARSVSDPGGSLAITVRAAEQLIRYRFGLNTLEILLCAQCGVYVAAIAPDGKDWLGVLNVNSLTDKTLYLPEPVVMDYAGENPAQRIARLKARWTPVKKLNLGKAA